MSELEQYRQCFDRVHAPEALVSEVMNMTVHQKVHPRRFSRALLCTAAAFILILALSIGAYASAPAIFGWARNAEILRDGDNRSLLLHTESLTDPVEQRDGRLWFIVNGERIDITDLVSETQPYLYQYEDAEGVTHYWIVGRNRPEQGSPIGYAEYLYSEEEGWLGGYLARTNQGPDMEEPLWFSAGKEQFSIP